MHKWSKEILECVKAKVSGIGLDNMDAEAVCELEKWACIADKIAEADYYYKIVEAMEKAEYGEDYDYRGKFYTTPKYYATPHHTQYHPTPLEDDGFENRGWDHSGRMYYSGRYNNEQMGGRMNSGRQGRSSASRMRYFTAKEEKTGNMEMDKRAKTEKMDEYFKDLHEDIKEMYADEPQEMKVQMKQKLMNIANQIV